jgi:hypothetical protein
MKEATKLLMRWCHWLVDNAGTMEWDTYKRAQSILDATLRFVGKQQRSQHATEKEEVLDKWLHEFVMTFVPEREAEEIIYANAAALTNELLPSNLREKVTPEVKKFMLEENRDDKTVESMAEIKARNVRSVQRES